MPLREYRCRSCHREIEVLERMDERPRRKCEACGGTLEKLVSRSGFVLKGTGWYATDYKKSDTTPKRDGSTEAGGTKSGSDSGDTSAAKPKDKSLAGAAKEK